MAFINRFSATTRGDIRFIGNTLGLSKLRDQNAAGVLGSIGAFTSLAATTVPTFPAGTTLAYTDNGSNANLTLPAGVTVLYAELIWGGNYRSRTQNISGVINNAVTFKTPLASVSVTQNPLTAQNFTYTANGLTLGYYVRSANVTALVQSAGSGTYATLGVPGLVDPIDGNTSDTNHAGWTLAVVYEDATRPIGRLNLWVGGEIVSPNTPSVDVTLSGFATPDTGSVTATIYVSAGEGDAILTGDQCLFGPSAAALANLSGPRNPATNFFGSQICNETGQLDTTGTFGTRNANPLTGTNISAGRQGWDITAVNGSAAMQNNQTTAVFRFTSDGDLYIPNALAIKVDADGAFIEADKTAAPAFVRVGEPIHYTLKFTNTGLIDATDVTVTDDLPAGLTLVPGSILVNGAPGPADFPVVIPAIAAGQSATVTFDALAAALPSPNPVTNAATVEYTFFPFPDFPITNTETTPPVSTLVIDERLIVPKAVDHAYAVHGDELLYTIAVQNAGNLDAVGTMFHDVIPAGTTFVPGSVTVNGMPQPAYDPSGFPLGIIPAGTTYTVTFKVTVD